MPVLPRVMVSAALNLRERGGGAKERRAKAALRNQAAPTAAQAVRWMNSRRFMGPPFGDRGGGLSIIWTSGSEVRLSRQNCERSRESLLSERQFIVRCLSLTIYLCAAYICRTSRRRDADREIRLAAGHAGHADSENCRAWPGARLRDRPANPADLQGSTAGAARLAVPCTAPAGKARLAGRGVGRVRQREAGQVLQVVGEGPQATGERGIELEPAGGSRGPHSSDGRIGGRYVLVEITVPQGRARRATRHGASLSYREASE